MSRCYFDPMLLLTCVFTSLGYAMLYYDHMKISETLFEYGKLMEKDEILPKDKVTTIFQFK